jgi:hypothetical protein
LCARSALAFLVFAGCSPSSSSETVDSGGAGSDATTDTSVSMNLQGDSSDETTADVAAGDDAGDSSEQDAADATAPIDATSEAAADSGPTDSGSEVNTILFDGRTWDPYPLVKKLTIEAGKATTARLLRVPPTEDSAELLRKDLWTVGARDDRLHTEDATRTMMVFHCLRDSGLHAHGRPRRLTNRHPVAGRAHGLQDDAGLHRSRSR